MAIRCRREMLPAVTAPFNAARRPAGRGRGGGAPGGARPAVRTGAAAGRARPAGPARGFTRVARGSGKGLSLPSSFGRGRSSELLKPFSKHPDVAFWIAGIEPREVVYALDDLRAG